MVLHAQGGRRWDPASRLGLVRRGEMCVSEERKAGYGWDVAT